MRQTIIVITRKLILTSTSRDRVVIAGINEKKYVIEQVDLRRCIQHTSARWHKGKRGQLEDTESIIMLGKHDKRRNIHRNRKYELSPWPHEKKKISIIILRCGLDSGDKMHLIIQERERLRTHRDPCFIILGKPYDKFSVL
jgi:hypothetical protein